MGYNQEINAERITAQINHAVNEQVSIGLDKAADKLVKALEQNAPSDPKTTVNKYKNSWVIKEHPNARYVGNSKRAKNSEIPLSNILESGDKYKDYMRKTYDNMEDELINIILDKLKF